MTFQAKPIVALNPLPTKYICLAMWNSSNIDIHHQLPLLNPIHKRLHPSNNYFPPLTFFSQFESQFQHTLSLLYHLPHTFLLRLPRLTHPPSPPPSLTPSPFPPVDNKPPLQSPLCRSSRQPLFPRHLYDFVEARVPNHSSLRTNYLSGSSSPPPMAPRHAGNIMILTKLQYLSTYRTPSRHSYCLL